MTLPHAERRALLERLELAGRGWVRPTSSTTGERLVAAVVQ
jgi:hypothetical protein